MKRIRLSNGHHAAAVVVVDAVDRDFLAQWRWHQDRHGYPRTYIPLAHHRDGCGVAHIRHTGKWRARITVDGIRRHLGCFPSRTRAALAYVAAVKKIYSPFQLQHGGQHLLMHQIVAERARVKASVLDHRNRNKLDNRRKNIRAANGSTNQANQNLSKNNKSGYKGVSWFKSMRTWRAAICVRRKSIHLGLFTNKKHAARAYNDAARKYFGAFAHLNRIQSHCPSR